MLSGMSPREDPNEASYPHVRESVESVPSGLIDPIFRLVYVLLRELLLQAWQRISARPFQRVRASGTHDLSTSLVSSASLSAGCDQIVNDSQRAIRPSD